MRLLGYGLSLAMAATAAGAFGYQKTYYSVLETAGIEKRELLTRRVEKAKESQQGAQDTFRDALEKFQHVTGHEGGELQQRYETLREAHEDSEDRAEEVRDRIDDVNSVGSALLEEWEQELDSYQDKSLRRKSAQALAATQRNFDRLLDAMHGAEKSLRPVLAKLSDRVLFLKHNLNARALKSLDEDLPGLERDVDELVSQMRASIEEADRFIADLSAASHRLPYRRAG